LIYYLIHPEDYYRRPIDPEFVVLTAFAVASWIGELNPGPVAEVPETAITSI
jgi:hypothetical protein